MNVAPGTPRPLPPSPAVKENKRLRKESGARYTDIVDPAKVSFFYINWLLVLNISNFVHEAIYLKFKLISNYILYYGCFKTVFVVHFRILTY